jgi:hypothetical protein
MKRVLHAGCFCLRHIFSGAWIGVSMTVTIYVALHGLPLVTTGLDTFFGVRRENPLLPPPTLGLLLVYICAWVCVGLVALGAGVSTYQLFFPTKAPKHQEPDYS